MPASKSSRYRNPWHKSGQPQYGPAFYETTVQPTKYRGYQIFRIHERHYDVVRNGVCVHQMAGPNVARKAVDKLTRRKLATA